MRYLNHAGTSWPKPAAVVHAVRDALSAEPSQHNELSERALGDIAGEFDSGRLLVTSGCTAALALVFADLPWIEGDVLLTSSLEHHALDRQAQMVELHRGVARIALGYEPGQPLDLPELQRQLSTGRVRAVAVTAASNVTGELLPLGQIAEHTRRHGALLIVDAAQTFGTDLFDEAAQVADVLVVAGHKAAQGPQGIGLLFARSEVEFTCPGASCEVGEQACATFPGFCDVGSVNLAGLCGLAAGLSWSRARGRARIGERTRSLAGQLRAALAERDDVQLLGPGADVDSRRMTAVVSFLPQRGALGEVARFFADRGVLVRGGTHCAPLALASLGVEGCVRVSFGPDSTEEDVALLLSGLDAL